MQRLIYRSPAELRRLQDLHHGLRTGLNAIDEMIKHQSARRLGFGLWCGFSCGWCCGGSVAHVLSFLRQAGQNTTPNGMPDMVATSIRGYGITKKVSSDAWAPSNIDAAPAGNRQLVSR